MEVHASSTFEHVSTGVYRLKYKGNRNNLTSIDILFDKVESWSDKTPLAVQVRGFNKNAVWRSINALPGYAFIISEQGEDEYITISFYEKCDIKDISTGKLVEMGVGVVSLVRRGQTVVFCAIKLSTKGAMAETREERRARMAQTQQLLEPFLRSVPLSSLYELNRDPLNRYAKLLVPDRVRELEKYPSLFVPIHKSASSLLITLERHKRLSPDQILADIHRAIVENPDLVQTIVDRISLGDYRELVTTAILRHDVALLDALLQDASPETWYEVLEQAFGERQRTKSTPILDYLTSSGKIPLNLFLLDHATLDSFNRSAARYLLSHGAIASDIYNDMLDRLYTNSAIKVVPLPSSGVPIDQQLVTVLHEKFPDVPVEEIEFSVKVGLEGHTPLQIYEYSEFESPAVDD